MVWPGGIWEFMQMMMGILEKFFGQRYVQNLYELYKAYTIYTLWDRLINAATLFCSLVL